MAKKESNKKEPIQKIHPSLPMEIWNKLQAEAKEEDREPYAQLVRILKKHYEKN